MSEQKKKKYAKGKKNKCKKMNEKASILIHLIDFHDKDKNRTQNISSSDETAIVTNINHKKNK